MKQRVYLDTSVLSALGDVRAPDRQALTREFFARIAEFEACTSDLTRAEVEGTPDANRRAEMLALLAGTTILAVGPEHHELARRYLDAGIFPASVPEDALHVAVAVLSRQDALVSWNFKHLVNRRRRAAVDALNRSLGHPVLPIISPPEL
ncbi:MAG TPA: PIN domain-containing protein [Phycisphaerales bacterium]|nr:PIN domain-containing protein [Phycisphaerales bacterium]